MSDYDRSSMTFTRKPTGGGGFYVAAGALVVAALVGAYVLMGAPGLHTQVANAPAGQRVDVTIKQPGAAPAETRDSAGPAPGR